MIQRQQHLATLEGLLRRHPVVGILGVRQVGKTTLARELAQAWQGPLTYFDLENPEDAVRLTEPMQALKPLRGLVVIDELQRHPELYPVLRVLADRTGDAEEPPARFLVLGSASPELLRQSSESLAGRIYYHPLAGFGLDEVGAERWRDLWIHGGFPRSFLAGSPRASLEWRNGVIRTFLERDLPQLGVQIPAETLRRFWTMIAHYHGQTWNGSEIARSFGVKMSTVRRYLDIMTSALVMRQLQPWYENLGKRQVKSPKVYIIDSGLLHALLNLETHHDLLAHPKIGASWEGFAIDEVVRRIGARPEECFFWGTHAGAELDLLVVRGRRRWGFEFKHTATPKMTRSMYTALSDLKLDRLDVVHTGEHTFPLAENVQALALPRLRHDLPTLDD
jgi:predicted AAA+ superfamily ATPase